MLADVNVLVYAYRIEAPRHLEYRNWFQQLINGDESFGTSDVVLSGFLRIVTNPRIFDPPSPIDQALDFVERVRSRPNCVPVSPGPRHWELFSRLIRLVEAKGNLIPDAFFAALAIESGSEWITTDRAFSRFPGLRWRHPLQ
jgi:toxin-antitoxin system PIN domain toxin